MKMETVFRQKIQLNAEVSFSLAYPKILYSVGMAKNMVIVYHTGE